jgi:sporulation protein YabP
METGGHILTLTDRESLSLTGVKDVDSFNEEQITAVTDCGQLDIKGELLHVEELNTDTGILTVSGSIISLVYSEKLTTQSLLKRLFGG